MEKQQLQIRKRNKLKLLPQHVLRRFAELVKNDCSDKLCKAQLLKEFPEHSDLLSASRNTYRALVQELRDKIASKSTPSLVSPLVSSAASDQPVANLGSRTIIQGVLKTQLDDATAQLNQLKQRQQFGVSDSSLDEQIANAEKRQRDAIKLLIDFDDDPSDPGIKSKLESLKSRDAEFLMIACKETCDELFGAEGWEEFKNVLEKNIRVQQTNFQLTFDLDKGI